MASQLKTSKSTPWNWAKKRVGGRLAFRHLNASWNYIHERHFPNLKSHPPPLPPPTSPSLLPPPPTLPILPSLGAGYPALLILLFYSRACGIISHRNSKCMQSHSSFEVLKVPPMKSVPILSTGWWENAPNVWNRRTCSWERSAQSAWRTFRF